MFRAGYYDLMGSSVTNHKKQHWFIFLYKGQLPTNLWTLLCPTTNSNAPLCDRFSMCLQSWQIPASTGGFKSIGKNVMKDTGGCFRAQMSNSLQWGPHTAHFNLTWTGPVKLTFLSVWRCLTKHFIPEVRKKSLCSTWTMSKMTGKFPVVLNVMFWGFFSFLFFFF